MYKIKEFTLVTAIWLVCWACDAKKGTSTTIPPGTMGILNLKTEFYDRNGKSILPMPMKVWYYDSLAIEEMTTTNSVTDTLKKTTVLIIPEGYRYIDLKSNRWDLYKTFDDTAQIIRSGILPYTVFPDGGWTFYANHLQMKSNPQVLSDTIIGGVKYMRIKFSRLKSRKANSYIIAWLRCDNKGKLFSFEKDFSSRVNCTMTRYYEFKEGASMPFASSELEFLSDTLSAKELKVFAAWKENQKNNPIH